VSGNPGNPNGNVSHFILASRLSESTKLSFVWRYSIIRIENTIPDGKASSTNFLNPKCDVVRHTSIVNYNQ
jgi:hypothetical protein